jgi:hypothetical protein
LTKQKPYDIIKSQGKESQRVNQKNFFKKNKKVLDKTKTL